MRTLKSILLHLDNSEHTQRRAQVASDVADAFDAHVTAQYCVTSGMQLYPMAVTSGAVAAAMLEDIDDERRRNAQAAFAVAASARPRLKWSDEKGVAPWNLWQRALYCDLMILEQYDASDPSAVDISSGFIPALIVDSGVPALIIPYTGVIGPIGRTVLVAWKETREAARAVAAAVPWLAGADAVHLVCYSEESGTLLQALAARLNARGITAKLHRGGPEGGEGGDAGENLLSLAMDVGADLLAMGCYGHGRAREWILGGVTRTILQSMTLPVLMVH